VIEDPNRPSEADLHAYIDGQLSHDRRVHVEAYLRAHPQEAQRMEDYRRLGDRLHALLDGALSEPVPHRLSRRPARRRSQLWPILIARAQIAASAIALAVGIMFGWLARDFVTARGALTTSLVQNAVGAHAVFTTDEGRPVEIEASSEEDLYRWLSKRLGQAIRAPNLSAMGYGLLGGRLLPSEQGPAAQFMYQNAAGDRLTLFVARIAATGVDVPIRAAHREPYRAFYWVDDDMACVLTGHVDDTTLATIARDAYQQVVED
jgi:anti-sigma factor RsiW